MSTTHPNIPQLILDLEEMLFHIIEKEEKHQDLIDEVHKIHQESARNLLNYIAFRSRDVRDSQNQLGSLGMTRLARAEAHIKPSLKNTIAHLRHYTAHSRPVGIEQIESIAQNAQLQLRNTERLIGKPRPHQRQRIMVTMPTVAAQNKELVKALVIAGMDCARINCAHDSSAVWLQIINQIKQVEEEVGRPISICMDLGGPKIRTGEIEDGPRVKKFLPVRDAYGQVVHPAAVNLVDDDTAVQKNKNIPVDKNWLNKLKVGDKLKLKDTRGKKRKLHVISTEALKILVHSQDSLYLKPGITITAPHGVTQIGELPPTAQKLFLRTGDHLVLTKTAEKGILAKFDAEGNLTQPARISCTLPEALNEVKEGEPIYFDDGKIKGKVVHKMEEHLMIEITHTPPAGAKLKADKGINFPDSDLHVSGLTSKDKKDLEFIVKHADIINFSFVNTVEDVRELYNHLEQLNAPDSLGVILKIETKQSYDNLADIILEAMKRPNLGVMIARGDLAIEAGWNKIGAIQKEILGICHASHVPVIWATQVLENMAKKGLPSRAEITDAVNATKADCIMLNKGPHIVQALELLCEIIVQSETYQAKNAPMLPRLEKISKEKADFF